MCSWTYTVSDGYMVVLLTVSDYSIFKHVKRTKKKFLEKFLSIRSDKTIYILQYM